MQCVTKMVLAVVVFACLVALARADSLPPAAPKSASNAIITVTFCPTYFSTRGATLALDARTGNLTIIGQFAWGQWLQGMCDILGDPTVAFARTKGAFGSTRNTLTLDFFRFLWPALRSATMLTYR